jgi:capsular exopolysaccharide synthesis family protein
MEPAVQNQLWSKTRVQLKRYFSVLTRLWWLLPLTTSVGTSIAAWAVSQMPPAYQSIGSMMVSGQIQLTNQGAGYNEAQVNFMGTQSALMKSGEVLQHALARVQTLHPELSPDEDLDYQVQVEPQTSIFVLKVTAKNPVFAQAYLDACMDEFIEAKRRQRQNSSDNTSVAISKELSDLNDEIDKSDAAVLEFQKANNIGFMQEEGNSAAKYLSQLNQQLSDLKTEYNLLQLFGDDVDQNLDRQQTKSADTTATPDDKPDTTLSSFGPIADYQRARQLETILKSQLADKSQRLKPKHPDIIALNEQIEKQEALITTLRSQSVDALKTHRENLRLEIQNLEGVIKEQEDKALILSGRLSEFEKLKTKADRVKAEYDRLLSNMHSVDVTKNVDQDSVTVLERASQSYSVKPGLTKIFITGIGGGLLVGLLIIFFIDQLDDRVGSLMELQAHFPEHLLGQIPKENMEAAGSSLLKAGDDRQGLFESFRTLRSSLIFLPVEGKRPKTLVVTSALPNEGKTTVASNLAITLAFSGAKTLLVDADMRSGKVSNLFGATGPKGLSQVLLQKQAWTDAVFMTSTDNLFILPCGPPLHHTAEHLLGKVTDQFLRDVYDAFDYVVFDTPPVIILDDTLSLSPKIDATLFVIRFNSSSVRSSRRAIELLTRRQANVIGIICNGVTLAETEYNYNYNYRRYYGGKYSEVKPTEAES